MKEISINQNSSTEKVKFGPVGRDIILNEKIEDETARAIAKETQLEEAIATAGAVKDVKCDGTSIVVSKVADIGPSIDTKVLVETTRATTKENELEQAIAGKSNATNIENGSGSGSVQMKSDGGITTFDFTGKNPNATALDPTLTGPITYGATGEFATSFGGKNAAPGKRASSQGSTTIAKGDYSDASGINSVSLGIGATAQGLSTTAYGQGAHSEGNNTLAIGPFSHTEGRNTITYNEEAHAGGLDSIAARPYSFAHGNYVVAENIAEAVFGQYNNFTGSESYDNNRLFVVGNGQDHTHRSNAFEVYKDGSAKVGKANGSETDLTVATKGYVDAQDAAEATARANADNELISQISNKADISALMNEGYARETADLALSYRIDSLESRGRFLSTWNATTGLPSTYPPIPETVTELTYTYNFRAGDYYIIHNVGTSNKKPTGSSIQATRTEIGQPWTWTIGSAEETEAVSNNGTYTYDGTNWVLMGAGAAAAWGSIGGNIADQADLSNALNAKANDNNVVHLTGQTSQSVAGTLVITDHIETQSGSNASYLGHIYPQSNNRYALGTSGNRWVDIFGKSIYSDTYLVALGFVDSELKPRYNDDYNLGRDDGSNVNRWKNIYVSQKLDFKAKTDTPATTASWQLDSRSNGNFVVSCNNGDAYIFRQNDFIPYGSNVNRNLGVAGNYWNDLYLKGKIDLYNSTSAQTWGLTGSQYDGIFITRSSANIYTFNTDGIFPSSNSARSLGTSDYKWKNIYFQGELNANGSAGTSGQVLTSNGSGAAPTWQDASGGGTPHITEATGTSITADAAWLHQHVGLSIIDNRPIFVLTGSGGATQSFTPYNSGNMLRISETSVSSELYYDIYFEDTYMNRVYYGIVQGTLVRNPANYYAALYPLYTGLNGNTSSAQKIKEWNTPIYAPTTSGTSGQFLKSNGENTAPTWTDAPAPSNMVTTDTPQTITAAKTFNNSRVFANNKVTQYSGTNSNNLYQVKCDTSNNLLLTCLSANKANGLVFTSSSLYPTKYDSDANDISLGTSDYKWKNIYFKGELNANGSAGTSGQVLTSNGANTAPTWADAPAPTNMVTTDTEQTITGTKYMRNLHVSQTSGNIPRIYFNLPTSLTTREIGLVNDAGTIELYTDANFVPNVTNSQTLGTNTTRWSTVYTSNIANQNISIPVDSIVTKDTIQTITGGKTFNTGGITIGNTGGVSKITFTGNASWGSSGFGINGGDPNDNNRPYFELAGHFRPTTDGTKQNLGDSSHKWKDIYAAGNISDGTNSTTVANIAVKSTESTETTGQLKIAVVTALPENPDANTLYFIKEA